MAFGPTLFLEWSNKPSEGSSDELKSFREKASLVQEEFPQPGKPKVILISGV